MIDFGFGVQLVALDSSDMATIRNWRNDRLIWQWCRQNDVISDVQQKEWFEKQHSDPSIKMWGIRSNGPLVGVCGLTSIDWVNRRAEFSLYIAPTYQGRGDGQKALATLLSHGFKNFGLNVIWGESFKGNPALDTFIKLGFHIDGFRRQFYFRDGKFIDATLVSITAYEWEDKCRNTQSAQPQESDSGSVLTG